MRMRKLVNGAYVVAMVVMLGACGGKQVPADNIGGIENVVTEQPEQQEAKGSDEENAVEEKVPVVNGNVENERESDVSNEEKEESKKTETENAFNVLPTIEETVLWDEKGIKITATGLTYSAYDAELAVLVENNSDKDVSVIAGSAGYCCNVINGYMVADGYMNEDISAGKKLKEKIKFSLEELSIYGINEIAEIQVGFDIEIEEEVIYTGPRLIRTSIADGYAYECNTYRENLENGGLERVYGCTVESFKENEKTIADGITILSYALITNSDKEQMLLVEIKNDSEEVVRLEAVGLTVNELLVYRWSMEWEFIAPDCYCVMGIELDSCIEKEYRSAFDLTSLDKIGFTARIRKESNPEKLVEREVCLDFNESVSPIDTTGTEVFHQDGIRVVSKGLYEDSYEYSDDLHMVLLVENKYPDTIYLENVYDSLSVNGFMTEYTLYSDTIEQGRSIVLDIEIDADSLAENDINGIEEVSEVAFSIEFLTKEYEKIAGVTAELHFN